MSKILWSKDPFAKNVVYFHKYFLSSPKQKGNEYPRPPALFGNSSSISHSLSQIWKLLCYQLKEWQHHAVEYVTFRAGVFFESGWFGIFYLDSVIYCNSTFCEEFHSEVLGKTPKQEALAITYGSVSKASNWGLNLIQLLIHWSNSGPVHLGNSAWAIRMIPQLFH